LCTKQRLSQERFNVQLHIALMSIIVHRLARAADRAFGHLADTRESFAVTRTDARARVEDLLMHVRAVSCSWNRIERSYVNDRLRFRRA